MTIRLLRNVDREFGLKVGLQIETYSGFGEECGTTRADGSPTGDVWVECPLVPVMRNRAGDVVSWKSAFVIVRKEDFEVVAAEITRSTSS